MKKKREIVLCILREAEEYLSFVDGIGNECAYTDRMIEFIYRNALKLQKLNDEQLARID